MFGKLFIHNVMPILIVHYDSGGNDGLEDALIIILGLAIKVATLGGVAVAEQKIRHKGEHDEDQEPE
jgi:hypothetical protein